jgi:asparagine synthase (glutamine-hydrolysing)
MFRAKTTFEALARDLVEGYFHGVSMMPTACATSCSRKVSAPPAGLPRDRGDARHAAKAPTDDPLSLIQYLDMKTYLPGDILTKVDRASMAHALEVRVPLLDHKFVEWVVRPAASLKLRGGEGKYIFKKALEPHLPRRHPVPPRWASRSRSRPGCAARCATVRRRCSARAARHRHLQRAT